MMQEEHREDSPDLRNQKLHINIVKREVDIEGEKIYLTTLEFNLLVYLTRHPNRVLTYQQIYEAVWEEPYFCQKGNIMTHISHLRKKIETKAKGICRIENMRGVGYRMIIQNL